MTALFGNTASSSSKNLVEFRAGKMNLLGTTVTPDKRKGLVYVYQSDDSLMHFCWKDRTSGKVEDDLIIFPDDIEFKRVGQCTTGRVYILKLKSSSRKFFFWLQEPKEDKDEENCKKVNKLLNNPPTPGSAGGGNTATSGANAAIAGLQPALASLSDRLGDNSFQSLLNNMDQSQLMQLLGMSGLSGGQASPLLTQDISRNATNAGSNRMRVSRTVDIPVGDLSRTPSSATETPAPPETPNPPAVQLSDLQNILSTMQVPASTSQDRVDLTSSFSTDALVPLLADKEVQTRLLPFLPQISDLPTAPNEIRESIQSPQFKQALTVFSAALQSGQLAPLMKQFDLPKEAVDAAGKGDIIGFMKALQNAERKTAEEVEDMALD